MRIEIHVHIHQDASQNQGIEPEVTIISQGVQAETLTEPIKLDLRYKFRVRDRVVLADPDACYEMLPSLPDEFRTAELVVKKVTYTEAYCRLPEAKSGYWLNFAWLDMAKSV